MTTALALCVTGFRFLGLKRTAVALREDDLVFVAPLGSRTVKWADVKNLDVKRNKHGRVKRIDMSIKRDLFGLMFANVGELDSLAVALSARYTKET